MSPSFPPKSGRDEAREHQETVPADGLRLDPNWVPGTRWPPSRPKLADRPWLLRGAPQADADQAFIDAVSEPDDAM